MILLNPKEHTRHYPDEESKQIILKTIEFFEKKGRARLKKDDHERTWYRDFLDFQKQEKIFSTLLTPSEYGEGNTRWDTYRNCEFNEVLGFYGLCYWYTWQVSILGLGPIWMSKNEELKKRAAKLLQEGEIFAFGLSEREHGADIYSTSMALEPLGDGKYKANGSKYYIGNGNEAKMVSTFGKFTDSGDYVFFNANYQNDKYDVVKNVVNSQSFVSEYKLEDYPIDEGEILHKGSEAWDAALNTVNVGKYNLGWASIGICTHALYEAIHHASYRRLYNMYVTDMPHVKQMFVDAYTRLVAMKLVALRASDYQRVASPEDRRYLLYNPVVKMKVTTQGEDVINLLWDVIAAKGFEKDTYFEMAARDIRALPKLEGTVHVNVALIAKFMPSYLFNPQEFPELGMQDQTTSDDYLFNAGPAKGLGNVTFHDYNIAYDSFDLPNLNVFKSQIALLKEMLMNAMPDKQQQRDMDFGLGLGELCTLVAYGQLILENAKIYKLEDALVDQIFDFMVRDFSKLALDLHNRQLTNEKQMEYCMKMIKKPVTDSGRYEKVWKEVHDLKDAYEMNE